MHLLLTPGVFFLQRTYRMPKDIHVEPEKFAAELINRLEEVQKEREAEEKLEERLKRVRAVSNLLASSTSLGVCLHTVYPRELSAAVETTGVTTFLLQQPWSSLAQGSWRLPLPQELPQCCSPVHAGLTELQHSLPAVRYQLWHSNAHFCHHLGAVDALHLLLWHPHSPDL